MQNLLIKANRTAQCLIDISPQSAGWKYIGFQVYQLKAFEQIELPAHDRESCLTIIAGKATVTVNGEPLGQVGSRESVFADAAPDAVYLGRDSFATIVAVTAVELAVSTAPATETRPHRIIRGNTMKRSVRGTGSNTRYICDILPDSDTTAENLLVVEVRTPAGHSSSYPPHKHDRHNPPLETQLEETYYHRLNPSQGFAFQRVYTSDRSLDQAMAVEDHDAVLVPHGYHPCVAPHGYELYYLNTMAGPMRKWHFFNDPDHEWLIQK